MDLKRRLEMRVTFNEKEKSNNIGNAIRFARFDADMKQADLAKMIGVNPRSLSDWERNVAKPSLESLSKIAKVLSCEIVFKGERILVKRSNRL